MTGDRSAVELSGLLPSGMRFAYGADAGWIVLRVGDQVTFVAPKWMPLDAAVELGIAMQQIAGADRG
ncbi:MAG TPA: hypothetical protein VGP44_10695 [Gemmatimonadales bacterium]|nr:hypothetical protein [Gemmatimonadales bacterium]